MIRCIWRFHSQAQRNADHFRLRASVSPIDSELQSAVAQRGVCERRRDGNSGSNSVIGDSARRRGLPDVCR